MSVPRKIAFAMLLAAALAGSGLWMFHFPYDREELYRAIPSNAAFISEHPVAALRWKEVAENPLVRNLLLSSGLKEKELDSTLEDADVDLWVRRLGRRSTLVAYVPGFGPSMKPAWVASTWGGGYSQFLRFILKWNLLKGFRRIDLEDGRQVWFQVVGRPPSTQMLSIAPARGLMVGCVSSDPLGALYMAERIQHTAPMAPALENRLREAEVSTADWCWLDGSLSGPFGIGAQAECLITRLDARSLEGSFHGTVPLTPAAALGESDAVRDLERTIGPEPQAVFVAPMEYVNQLSTNLHPAAGMLSGLLRQVAATNAPLSLALYGGEYSGRILGLKVPTLVIGMKVQEGAAAIGRVADAVDGLNSVFNWGLLASRAELTGRPSLTVAGTRGGIYESLKPGERPVLLADRSWLLLVSNKDAAGKLLSGTSTNEPAGGEGEHGVASTRWGRDLAAHGEAVAALWVDLESANQAIRNGLAVYSLALMAENRDANERLLRSVDGSRAWVNALQPLRVCRMALSPERPRGFRLDFSLGDRP